MAALNILYYRRTTVDWLFRDRMADLHRTFIVSEPIDIAKDFLFDSDSPSYYINSPAFISDATFQLSPQTLYNRSLGGSLATALSDSFGHWLNPPAIPPYGAENENGRVDRTAAFSPPRSPLIRVEEQAGEVDWSDPRVQQWSSEERLENERWLDAGQIKFAMQAQLEVCHRRPPLQKKLN